jgi:D-tyrosyl-tRNA(Tyr) deacylase
MRAVIQRVSSASITIDHREEKYIQTGLVVLVGIENGDVEEDIKWLCGKISRLRIFPDQNEIMNLSVLEINGDVMIVSQFTLHASTKKGNRPSYIRAAPTEIAIPLYEQFVRQMEQDLKRNVVTGKFGAHMDIHLVNNGPVTIFIDTKRRE